MSQDRSPTTRSKSKKFSPSSLFKSSSRSNKEALEGSSTPLLNLDNIFPEVENPEQYRETVAYMELFFSTQEEINTLERSAFLSNIECKHLYSLKDQQPIQLCKSQLITTIKDDLLGTFLLPAYCQYIGNKENVQEILKYLATSILCIMSNNLKYISKFCGVEIDEHDSKTTQQLVEELLIARSVEKLCFHHLPPDLQLALKKTFPEAIEKYDQKVLKLIETKKQFHQLSDARNPLLYMGLDNFSEHINTKEVIKIFIRAPCNSEAIISFGTLSKLLLSTKENNPEAIFIKKAACPNLFNFQDGEQGTLICKEINNKMASLIFSQKENNDAASLNELMAFLMKTQKTKATKILFDECKKNYPTIDLTNEKNRDNLLFSYQTVLDAIIELILCEDEKNLTSCVNKIIEKQKLPIVKMPELKLESKQPEKNIFDNAPTYPDTLFNPHPQVIHSAGSNTNPVISPTITNTNVLEPKITTTEVEKKLDAPVKKTADDFSEVSSEEESSTLKK